MQGFQKGNKLGAGRPKAGHTLLAAKMRERIVERVHKELDPILDAQLSLAKGITIMLTRNKIKQENGKYKRCGKWYQVTKADEIEMLLNEKDPDDSFYKITLKDPDAKAAGYLLDQAVGRAKQTIETPGLSESLADLVIRLNKEK